MECEGILNTEESNLTLKDVFSKLTGPVLRISNSNSNKKSSNTNSNKEKTEIVLLWVVSRLNLIFLCT